MGFGEICFIVLMSVGALFGYFVFCGLLLQLFVGKKSPSWPGVEGIITKSEIDESSSFDKGGNGKNLYYPTIKYEYIIDGITYWGRCIKAGSSGNGKYKNARTFIKKYPMGKKVKVYYCPMWRKLSVLEPGLKGDALLLVGFMVLSLGLAVIFSGVVAFFL